MHGSEAAAADAAARDGTRGAGRRRGAVAYAATAAGDPDVHAALRAADHEHRRAAPADPELLRRPARHRDVRARQLLRQGGRARRGDGARYARRRSPARGTRATQPASRRSCSTSTTRRSRPGTTRSSATGRSTRRRTPTSSLGQLFPAGARHGRHGNQAAEAGLRDLLPDRPAGGAGGRDARQPDDRRRRRGRGLPGADDSSTNGEDGLFTKPAVADYPALPHRPRAPATRTARARRSTTSRRRARTSSRSATTSSRTSATSSATSRAASPTARSSCRTRTTSCRRQTARPRVRKSGRAGGPVAIIQASSRCPTRATTSSSSAAGRPAARSPTG